MRRKIFPHFLPDSALRGTIYEALPLFLGVFERPEM